MFNDKPGNYSVDQIKHGNYLKIVKVPKWKPKAQNQQPSAHLENYSIHVKRVVETTNTESGLWTTKEENDIRRDRNPSF
uniref:Putative ovule protein n=1 Tax=Solanum chacoense TaxID=4108 RepID=A0A0V0GPB3_SOLCH